MRKRERIVETGRSWTVGSGEESVRWDSGFHVVVGGGGGGEEAGFSKSGGGIWGIHGREKWRRRKKVWFLKKKWENEKPFQVFINGFPFSFRDWKSVGSNLQIEQKGKNKNIKRNQCQFTFLSLLNFVQLLMLVSPNISAVNKLLRRNKSVSYWYTC